MKTSTQNDTVKLFPVLSVPTLDVFLMSVFVAFYHDSRVQISSFITQEIEVTL